jgi:hypothetical protein
MHCNFLCSSSKRRSGLAAPKSGNGNGKRTQKTPALFRAGVSSWSSIG